MSSNHIVLTDYEGDPNIGFHGLATEDFAILAPGFKEKDALQAESVCETYLSNTDLVGLFAAGNSNGVLLPRMVSDHEKANLEDAGIRYTVLDVDHTAIGNLILANDKGCFLSERLSSHKQEIADFLDVPVAVGRVAGLVIVGSAGVATNSGVLLHRETSEEELENIEAVLQVDADIGTLNFGSPYVGSGAVANSAAAVLGNATTGPEIGRVEQALGFLD